jgi:hypothetical protein
MSVDFHQTTRHYIPEDRTLHTKLLVINSITVLKDCDNDLVSSWEYFFYVQHADRKIHRNTFYYGRNKTAKLL